MTKNDVLTAFGQAAHLNYPGQSFRDADSFSGGLSWSHGYGGRGRPVVFASGFGGVDDVDKSGTPNSHFGRVFFGARIGGQYSYNRKTTLFGSVLYQHSNYGASDPVFNKRRTDDLLDLTAGVNYQVARDWVLVPQIRYTNNSSTIGVDDYDRAQLFVSARRSFN